MAPRFERLTIGVGGVRVGAEVVVERHVFLEDHHNVLDRRGRPADLVVAPHRVALTMVSESVVQAMGQGDLDQPYARCHRGYRD